ncbi:MAG TPA: hypothetical protein VGP72_17895 [Planctomycetota bacterium]|jgi:hypothetical protein
MKMIAHSIAGDSAYVHIGYVSASGGSRWTIEAARPQLQPASDKTAPAKAPSEPAVIASVGQPVLSEENAPPAAQFATPLGLLAAFALALYIAATPYLHARRAITYRRPTLRLRPARRLRPSLR